METMTLKIPVTVKAKVTEALKQELKDEVKAALQKVEMDLQQFDFHTRRMMAEQAQQDAQALVAMRQKIDADRKQMDAAKAQLDERMTAADKLELGSEIVRGQMEQMITVKVGDDIHKVMNAEIVLEDGSLFRAKRVSPHLKIRNCRANIGITRQKVGPRRLLAVDRTLRPQFVEHLMGIVAKCRVERRQLKDVGKPFSGHGPASWV